VKLISEENLVPQPASRSAHTRYDSRFDTGLFELVRPLSLLHSVSLLQLFLFLPVWSRQLGNQAQYCSIPRDVMKVYALRVTRCVCENKWNYVSGTFPISELRTFVVLGLI